MDAYNFDSRVQFETIAFGSIAVILAIGVLFYILGTPTRRQLVDVPIQPGVEPGRRRRRRRPSSQVRWRECPATRS